MIKNETLSDLVAFDPHNYLTTTLYLQIDGSPQPGHAIELKALIKQRKEELNNQEIEPAVRESVAADLKKMSDFVNLKFSRQGAKTLILFSCSARKLWEVLTVNLPLRSELVIASRPHLRPLNFILEEYKRFLVVLVERSRARLFEVYGGEVQEHTAILDEVPGKVKMGGYSGYEERRIARHIEDHVRRHFKHVADAAYDLDKQHCFDRIVLCGSEPNTSEFLHFLRSVLQEKTVGSYPEDINATPRMILDRVMQVEKEMKEREDKKLLDRLFGQVNSGGLGVVGLDPTIRALHQGQVNYLVVQEGYGKNGYRCRDCRGLLTSNGSCDYCGGTTQAVPDIVDEVVQEALHQGCQVKYITLPGTPLDMAGKIGAMLRFKA